MLAYAEFTLHIPWAHSLKEKRMVARSLTDGVRARFNVSIAQVDALDLHQTLVLGVAGICQSAAQADKLMEQILSYIEGNADAQVLGVEQQRF